MGEIHDHSREKAGLRDSEEETRGVELPGRMHEARDDGDEAPADHDSRHPFSRTPTFHNHRTRNFKQNVTEEENSRSKTEDAVGESEIDAHAKIREGHIHPIDVTYDVQEKHERQQTNRDSSAGPLADVQAVKFHRYTLRLQEVLRSLKKSVKAFPPRTRSEKAGSPSQAARQLKEIPGVPGRLIRLRLFAVPHF
jgi:hypothetical protein